MDRVCCWNCKFFDYDFSTGTSDCKRVDDMTEDEFERYYGDDEPNCPYHEYPEYPED